MNENSELLLYLHENTLMGAKSTKKLLNLLNSSDNKIKPLVEEELKEYEKYLKEIKKIMKQNQVTKQKSNLLAEITSSIAMDIEFMKDNSDAKIADILIRGFTMGSIDLNKKIEKYESNADAKIIKLAKQIKKFNEENINLLKKYL